MPNLALLSVSTHAQPLQSMDPWTPLDDIALLKSLEIIFERPRSNRKQTIPPPAVPGICRVEHVKVCEAAKCSQSLFALRTLRQHGLPPDALHAVLQAVVINKLIYASPAWYGFTSAADRKKDDWTFLRRSARLGYRDAQSSSFDSLCETADEQLFLKIIKNKQHLLRSLLYTSAA